MAPTCNVKPLLISQVGGGIHTYNMPSIKSSLKRALRAKSKAWCTFDEFPTISNLNLALFKNQNFENLETKAKLSYEKVITYELKHILRHFTLIFVIDVKLNQLLLP